MTGLREWTKNKAREYVLEHPDESKEQQAVGAGVSTSTIATARKELVAEGKLASPRKKVLVAPPKKKPKSEWKPPPERVASPETQASMLDHEAMSAMADMIEVSTVDTDVDDDEVIRRLLRQCLRFAFDPKLHPDTRMSASQMWTKLRDQAKSKNLGPGPPKTYEDARARLIDVQVAVGPKMTFDALFRSFDRQVIFTELSSILPPAGDADEGQVPADASAAAPGAPGATAAP